jgi:hypothetical protein
MYSLVVVRFQGMNEKGQWFNMNAWIKQRNGIMIALEISKC